MLWLELIRAVFVAVLVVGIVGIPLARAIGLRGFAQFGLAPAFALTMIGGTAIVAPWVGLAWSTLAVLLVTAVVGGILWGVRRIARTQQSSSPPRRRFDFWLLGGLVLAVILLAVRTVAIFGAPDNISQTFDNVFHLNGVRFVLDTGNASSLAIGRMTSPSGGLAFYPAAWHGFVSLIVQLSGVSIPVAINAVSLVVSAVVWPLSIIFLTRTLFGRSPVLSVSAGALAASLPVFPLLLLDYGVLYPYQLGLALVPAALAATAGALGVGKRESASLRWWWFVAVFGTLPAIALSHPGAFVAWLLLSLPLVLAFVVRGLRLATWSLRALIVAAALAYGYVIYLLLEVLRPPLEARQWPLQMRLREAVWDVISVSSWYHVAAIVAAVAVAAGIFWVLANRSEAGLVSLGMYGVAAFLFINVAAMPDLAVRDFWTGPFYNNLPRLAAVLPLAMVPLGAYGVACTWARLTASAPIGSLIARASTPARYAVAAAIALLSIAAMQIGPLTPVSVAQSWAAVNFTQEYLLSSDEEELLARVDQHVPEGVAIVGSPWTGASLAFALADRPVLMPHTLMEITDDVALVNDGLNEAERGDQVCQALSQLNAGFVLDFGEREVHPGQHVYQGLTDLQSSPAVRLIDEQGEARLYEIVACSR